jgi:hypothetical protein
MEPALPMAKCRVRATSGSSAVPVRLFLFKENPRFLSVAVLITGRRLCGHVLWGSVM